MDLSPDHILPRGRTLSDARWQRRHRAMLVLLALHALVIPALAIATGTPAAHAVGEAVLLALVTALAALPVLDRRARAVLVTFGLMSASALVVHVSGGVTEAHFHFFVVLSLLAVYEDWVPFGVAIAYVFGHHGVLGGLHPEMVVAGRDSDEAWRWAAIHTAYIGAAAVANIVTWRLNGDVREDARRGERRYRMVVDGVSQVIFQTDAEGRLVFLNPAWERLSRTPVSATLGRSALELVLPEDRPEAERLLAVRDGRARATLRHIGVDGECRWFEVRTQPAAGGEGVFGTILDVTDRRRSEEQLTHRALHDALTGLPNRTVFLDRLDQALARAARDHGHVAVLFIDVDDFKQVNDELGHDEGDALLRRVADVLSDEIRGGDTAARFGGDEFAVLCENDADRAAAEEVARRILARFADAPTTLSIGIAVGDGLTPSPRLLREADAAMYRAKALGRNGLAVFDDGMRTTAREQLRLEQELARALDAGELGIRLQPAVRLDDGVVVGFEALLRWDHPQRGVLEPAAFLATAEQAGLMVPIGDRVLRAACAWLGRTASADAVVAVNVSPGQLADRWFPERVAAAIADAGIAPEQLVLEIAESQADDRRARAALDALAATGVRFVLDDFGTGAASLRSLRRIPISGVKVDGAIVAGLTTDPADAATVAAVAAMTRALGIAPVAEGVETAEQARDVEALGCRVAQGAHFGLPLTEDEAAALLDGQRSAAGQTIR